MGGADVVSVIGRTNAASERRARELARSLDAVSRGRRERTLLALGELWWPDVSCFRPLKDHALPTRDVLDRVAAHVVREAEETTRIAAVVAIRKAWLACDAMRSKAGAFHESTDRPPNTVDAIATALGDRARLVRLAAATAAAQAPCVELAPRLELTLDDEVWAARWAAVAALAALAADQARLVDVLRGCRPRRAHHGFVRAVIAVQKRGGAIPAEWLSTDR